MMGKGFVWLSCCVFLVSSFFISSVSARVVSNDHSRVKELASHISAQAESLYYRAQSAAYHGGDDAANQALTDLRNFSSYAQSFERQLSIYNDAREQYRALVESFSELQISFYRVRSFNHLRIDFENLQSLIRELQQEYSRYPGDPGDNYNWYEVRRLAQRIESDTVDLRRRAEWASRGTWDEQRALRDLRALESRASQFRRSVDFNRNGSSWVVRDYRELARAYREAGYTFSVVNSFWHLQNDFERIGQTIQAVRRYLRDTEDPYPYYRSI